MIEYPIKLVIENPNDSLIVLENPPENISLDVGGRGWVLFRKTFWLNNDPILLEIPSPVDTKYVTRSTLLPLAEQKLGDLTINSILDDTIFFSVERRISKKVRVTIDSTSISLDNSYQFISPIGFSPDSVLIAGPTTLINNLPDSIALKIEEEDIESNFQDKVSSNVLDLAHVTFYPEEVSISFNVAQFDSGEMQVTLKFLNFPDPSEWVASDSVVSVKYKAPVEDFEKIDSSNIRVVADLRFLNSMDSAIDLWSITDYNLIKIQEIIPSRIRLQLSE